MLSIETPQHFGAAEARKGTAYLMHLLQGNARARDALSLASERGLDLGAVVKLLHQVLLPAPAFQWGLLGYPSALQVDGILRSVTRLIDELEAGEPRDTCSIPEMPALQVCILLFHESAPWSLNEAVRLIGKQEVIDRLRSFARMANASKLVS